MFSARFCRTVGAFKACPGFDYAVGFGGAVGCLVKGRVKALKPLLQHFVVEPQHLMQGTDHVLHSHSPQKDVEIIFSGDVPPPHEEQEGRWDSPPSPQLQG